MFVVFILDHVLPVHAKTIVLHTADILSTFKVLVVAYITMVSTTIK